jgi:CheY-like chemotaxis protein
MKPPSETPRSPGPPRVLLVDDSDILLRVLQRALQGLKCVIVTAATIAEARACCEGESRVDLAIVDRQLEDGDGLALIAELTARLGDDAPRFVLHTGHAIDGPLPTGVSAVLSKPAGVAELRTFVQAQLDALT